LLQDGRSGDRFPIGTGPGAHSSSFTVGTGPFPGVKRSVYGVNNPAPSSAKVEEREEIYLKTPVSLHGRL